MRQIVSAPILVLLAAGYVAGQDTAPWRLSAEPTVRIGLVEGAPEYLFDRVVGALTLSDGTIAVADMGSSQVRLFDASGRFRSAFGTKGQGPGEFRQLIGLFRAAGDTLIAVDRFERLHFFGPDGGYARSLRTGVLVIDVDALALHETDDYPRVVGFFDDGSWVRRDFAGVEMRAGNQFVDVQTPEITFTRVSPDGEELHELARLPGRTYVPHPSNLILPEVFAADVHAGVQGHELVLGLAGTGEVRWLAANGETRRVATHPWTQPPVTHAMFDAHVAGSAPPLREELVRGRVPAETLPRADPAVRIDRC